MADDTYGHTPARKAFDQGDVYGIGYDAERVARRSLRFDEEFGGYMGIIENFAQTIRGLEQPLVTGWDGYRALGLLRAAQMSLSRHAAVTLPLDPAEADQEALDWLRAGGWQA